MASGILFDFNGVIIDDEPQHCDALIATLAEYGYPLDRETYYRDYLGFDDRECFRFTFARDGETVEESRLLEAIERKNEHYERAIRADMRLVPGAVDFVEAAALDGHQLAIVSGALRREIALVLELAGLAPHFAEIVAAEDVSACKPDPQGFNRAREALGRRGRALRRDRGFASRPRGRPRRRAALRDALDLARRGFSRRGRRGVARFRRPGARRAALGP